jgi:diguanylate cyclase (GGDEF)-like protein/PAS domain S-box-containing protein
VGATTTTTGLASERGRWRRLGRLAALLATVVLATLTAWGIFAWERREAASREAVSLAGRLGDQVRLVEALAGRAGSSPEAQVALDDARQGAASSFDRLRRLEANGASDASLEGLERSLAAFDASLDAFLAGGADGMAAPDASAVGAATLAVQDSAGRAAERADRVADIGAMLGFVAAVMLGAVVLARRGREAGQAHERAAAWEGPDRAGEIGATGTARLRITRPLIAIAGGGGRADELAGGPDLLQTLIDSLPDRIAIKEASGRLARVNLAYATWLGLEDPAKAVGHFDGDFVPAPVAELIATDVLRALAAGEPELDRVEQVPAGADGLGSSWALVSRVPLRDGGGLVSGLIETRREIAAHPDAEAAPRLRERAVAATSAGIAIADATRPGMPLVDVNPAFERLTGYPAVEAIGREPLALLGANADPSDAKTNQEAIAELRVAMATGDATTQELLLRRRDGGTIWADVHVEAMPIEPGRSSGDGRRFSHVVIELEDATEQRDAERRVRSAEAKYRTLVERNPAVTYAVRVMERSGGSGSAVYVSPQIEQLLGYPASAWRSDPNLRSKLVHPDDRLSWEAEHERAAASGETFRLEYRLIAKGGRVVWVRDEAVPVADEDGRAAYWQGFLLDITDRKSLEERLERQAFRDPLTNLANQELFLDRLGNALARAAWANRAVGVLCVDLDDFGTINDGLGRQVGDQVLKAIGDRLVQCVRQGDTVARTESDEFAILLDELADPGEVARIAERIVEGLRAPLRLARGPVYVTGSVGVAISRSAFDPPEDLLRDAEAAMREAKTRGKARHAVYEAGMSAKTWARLDLELELRRGIEGGELVLHYQPVVALDSGRIREVEALVRWQHPERGLVVPGDFVPLAEETGLIVPLGLKILEQGCRQVRAWQAAYPQQPPLSLAVNLSRYQFQRSDFAEEVGRILILTGLDPACLKLEISESIVAADADATADILEELKGLGVRLAIDDFGTGYATMSYLERFPIDGLKIDRTFVARLGPQGDDPAMVRAVIAFAKMLDLQITAEGIETVDQLRRLRELGCDLGQGYHFAKPLPVEVMADLLAAAPRWLEARSGGAASPTRPRPIGVGTGLLPAMPAIPAAS